MKEILCEELLIRVKKDKGEVDFMLDNGHSYVNMKLSYLQAKTLSKILEEVNEDDE